MYQEASWVVNAVADPYCCMPIGTSCAKVSHEVRVLGTRLCSVLQNDHSGLGSCDPVPGWTVDQQPIILSSSVPQKYYVYRDSLNMSVVEKHPRSEILQHLFFVLIPTQLCS